MRSKGGWQDNILLYIIIGVIIIILGYFAIGTINKYLQDKTNGNDTPTVIISPEDNNEKKPLSEGEIDIINYNSVDFNNSNQLYLNTYKINKESELDKILTKLRSGKELQKINPFNEGKDIQDISPPKYFYLSGVYLDKKHFYGDENFLTVLKEHSPVKVEWGFKTSGYEIHYPTNDELYLLGYVSEETASRITYLDNEEVNDFMIFTYLWESKNIDTLIIIPIHRIIGTSLRTLKDEKGYSRYVLDIKIK